MGNSGPEEIGKGNIKIFSVYSVKPNDEKDCKAIQFSNKNSDENTVKFAIKM